MYKLSPALAVILSVSLLPARQDTVSCGTHPFKLEEQAHLHRVAERGGHKRIRRAAVPLAGERYVEGKSVRDDIGNIAVLDDADGVVSRRNSFNLHRRMLRFVPAVSPAGPGYSYELTDSTWDASSVDPATRVTGLADDDTREIALPFQFPFFGKQYSSLWLNSDGNVTFGTGDGNSTARSLGRMSAGAPRIAALFRDLDPSRAPSGGGIFAGMSGGAFTVTWLQLPEYRDTGRGPLQTVHLRLQSDGVIEIIFADVTTTEAVVGIGPGGLVAPTTVVSFLNKPTGTVTGAVAERFASTEEIDIISAAQKFYLNHDDSYDYLVFFNDLDIDADDGVVAYEVTLRNNRTGYGDGLVNTGIETGSLRRLQAIMNMGQLSQYPTDPDGKVPARFSVGDTPLTTLAHEAGHLFLAFASVRDEDNNRPMLGGQAMAHWAFSFNSEASLMEGNRIQDNGPTASPRFLTTATVEGFSPLDQYLMGLRAPEEVPDTFYVHNPSGLGVRGLPRVGVSFDGERRDVRVDDLIRAEGRRTPDHTVAQRRFRFAFVLITGAGATPSAERLAQLETWRTRFEQFYNRATSNRAFADTSLRNALHVSLWPAVGVIAGSSATGTVSIQRAAETPLTVLLRTTSGNAGAPSSVTIPAGSSRVEFPITGIRQGTDEIIAEPANPSFETVYARVQVAAPQALRLALVSGDRQTATPGVPLPEPVRVRVTDLNNLPYPGVPVAISLSGGGSVSPASASTDQDGIASVRWTPGTGDVNELRAETAGGTAVTATALGRPLFATGSVVNAASYSPGLTPGGIGTIFGANLTGSTTEVLLNGSVTRLLYADTRQINFLVPQSVTAGTADLVVRTNAGSSVTVSSTVLAVQPGIFFDTATGYGAVLTAGTGQVTQVRPVARGEIIEIYTTGLGSTNSSPDGNRRTTVQPQVSIGGATAEVIFSGLAPGFVGLYQINAVVPSSVTAGAVPLAVTAGGIRSNEVRIQVR